MECITEMLHVQITFSGNQQQAGPCRMPWRLAVYFWETADRRVLPVMRAQVGFFERQEQLSAGYRLDGTGLVDYVNICFLAPVGALFRVSVAPHTQTTPCQVLPLTPKHVLSSLAKFAGHEVLRHSSVCFRAPFCREKWRPWMEVSILSNVCVACLQAMAEGSGTGPKFLAACGLDPSFLDWR